jgi:tetratricopeptide (TPR) repeat protein
MFIEATTFEKILLVPLILMVGYRACELYVFRRHVGWVWSNFAWVLLASCLGALGLLTEHPLAGYVPAYLILLFMPITQAIFVGLAYGFLLSLYVPLFLFCARALQFLQFDRRGQLWGDRIKTIHLHMRGDADSAKALINRWNKEFLPGEGMLAGNHLVAFTGARIADNIDDMLEEGQIIKETCPRYSWHVGCGVARAFGEKRQIRRTLEVLEYIGPGPALEPVQPHMLERSAALSAEFWALRGLVEKPDQAQLDLYLPNFYALFGAREELEQVLARLVAKYKTYPEEARQLLMGICSFAMGNKEEAKEHLNKSLALSQEQLDKNAAKSWPTRISNSRARRWLGIVESDDGIADGEELAQARGRLSEIVAHWRAGTAVRKLTAEDAQLLAGKQASVQSGLVGAKLFSKGPGLIFLKYTFYLVLVGSVFWIVGQDKGGSVRSRDPFTRAAGLMRIAGGLHDNDRIISINIGFGGDGKSEYASLLDEVLRKEPTNSAAYYLRGCAYANLEQPELDKAVQDFTSAIKLSPRWANAYYRLGRCYERQGNLDQAQARFKQALSLVPNDIAATTHLKSCMSPTRIHTR